ncbi:hypothetical protein JCM8097_004142 [Rhodosporidiobolus ruineniae]
MLSILLALADDAVGAAILSAVLLRLSTFQPPLYHPVHRLAAVWRSSLFRAHDPTGPTSTPQQTSREVAPTTDGACWVCAEPAELRCQSCGEAGVDIVFCSREHQRAVWPIHRFFCGPGKAKPFLFPALSTEEADMAKTFRDDLYKDLTQAPLGETCLRNVLVSQGGVQEKGIKKLLVRLTVKKKSCNLARPSGKDQQLLSLIRSSETMRQLGDPRVTAISYSLGMCSRVKLRHLDPLLASLGSSQPDDDPFPWLDALLHRLSVFFLLVDFAGRSLWHVDLSHATCAYASLVAFINEEVKPTVPAELAKELLADVEEEYKLLRNCGGEARSSCVVA